MGIVPRDRGQGKGVGPPRLLPRHLADLRRSGLSDAQIEACGFYSESDPAAVAWPGRRVYIAFDSDLTDKPDVRRAEWHLSEALRAAGADVRAVRLPPGPGGEKAGLDDFLLARGPDALRERIATAGPVP